MEGALVRQLGPITGQGRRMAQADLVGPVLQLLAAKALTQGEEQGVVRQPVCLLHHKFRQWLGVAHPAAFPCPPQQGDAGLVQPGIVHPVGVGPPGGVQFLLSEQALPGQLLQIQEKGVARERGWRHVGGITAAGRNQGENLPELLPGLGQKVDEAPGGNAKGADAIGPRQGKDGKQDTACARLHTKTSNVERTVVCSIIIHQRGRRNPCLAELSGCRKPSCQRLRREG